MSDTATVIVAFIGAAQAVGVAYFGWKLKQQGDHIQEIKKATNGMSNRLEEAAQARGNLEGRAEQTAENKAKQ